MSDVPGWTSTQRYPCEPVPQRTRMFWGSMRDAAPFWYFTYTGSPSEFRWGWLATNNWLRIIPQNTNVRWAWALQGQSNQTDLWIEPIQNTGSNPPPSSHPWGLRVFLINEFDNRFAEYSFKHWIAGPLPWPSRLVTIVVPSSSWVPDPSNYFTVVPPAGELTLETVQCRPGWKPLMLPA